MKICLGDILPLIKNYEEITLNGFSYNVKFISNKMLQEEVIEIAVDLWEERPYIKIKNTN